jgi:hypothetical protein
MKRPELIGAAIGGVIGLSISLGMDLLLGEGVGQGWRNAVSHDLSRLLNSTISPDSLIAYLGALLAIACLSAFAAAAGYVFVRIVQRFFRMLLSEE